jgi:hypothetical protein
MVSRFLFGVLILFVVLCLERAPPNRVGYAQEMSHRPQTLSNSDFLKQVGPENVVIL